MNAPRTTATDGAAKWDSSRTVTRGVTTGVEARRAKALGQEKDKRRGSSSQPPKQGSSSNEALANFLGLVWIVIGGIVIVLCLMFVVGSVVMFGVLREISDARNYDNAASRYASYEDFFKKVADAGFKVESDKPNIKDGVTTYLWTVTPPNDGAMKVFSWQHDLKDNEVRPTSNAAALLDIDLGNLDQAKAQDYAATDNRFQFDPNDQVVKDIIDLNTSAFAKNNATGWGAQPMLANAPPLPPPLFDPHARTRKGVGAAPAAADGEEAATDENPTDGGDGDQAAEPAQPPSDTQPDPDPEPPTEVQPAEPPAEGGGDGNDSGDQDGKKPKPKPEPGDGEGDGDGDATPVG